MLERRSPFTVPNPERTRQTRYYLADNYLAFWFRFVLPNRSALEQGQARYVWEARIQPQLSSYMGPRFEELCRQYIRLRPERWGHPIGELSVWWRANDELEIVGHDGGVVVLAAEAKWRNDPVDMDVLQTLQRRVALLPRVAPDARLALFANSASRAWRPCGHPICSCSPSTTCCREGARADGETFGTPSFVALVPHSQTSRFPRRHGLPLIVRLRYAYTYDILVHTPSLQVKEKHMMPNKTIYVAEADAPVFDKAQALAGGNLSAAIAQAIRQFVSIRQSAATEGAESSADASEEIILAVTEEGIRTKKRFRGRLIAAQRLPAAAGDSELRYRVYQSEKGKFVVWSRSGQGWSGDWWRAQTRLDIFDTVEDLHGNIPVALYARVLRVTESGSDIEDLDV